MEKQVCFQCFKEINEPNAPCPHCGFELKKNQTYYPQALPCGSTLMGTYTVGRALGQGGFGITYVAMDRVTGERMAIKEYFPQMLSFRENRSTVQPYAKHLENFNDGKRWFLDEAKVLAELAEVPNIVRVHRYFEENGTAYFVMDYLEGYSLAERLVAPVSWKEMSCYIYPIMEALAIVHQRGIIHRDVAPDNIFITKTGEMRLLDFGAARYSLGKESQSLDVVLKRGYAPKEQYSRRGKQGSWTDVYATAAVIYHGLTGRPPMDSIDREEGDIRPLRESGIDITPQMDAVILRALSVKAEKRYQSMGEFLLALKQAEKIEKTENQDIRFEDLFRAKSSQKEPQVRTVTLDGDRTEEKQERKTEEPKIQQEPVREKVAAGKEKKAQKKGSRRKKWTVGTVVGLAVSLNILIRGLGGISQMLGEVFSPIGESQEEFFGIDEIKNVNVGDYVTFGSYEQDNDLSNGKEAIRWKVLAKENGKVLVISEKCLDAIPYNEQRVSITWADCTLRQWLNGEFFEDSFSEAEKQQIMSQTIQNLDNPYCETDGGEDTTDRVFLLSMGEVNRYFALDKDRQAEATDYAVEQGIHVDSDNGNTGWRLRTPGDYGNDAAVVTSNGVVNYYGYDVYKSSFGVRPALYISVDHLNEEEAENNTEQELQETAPAIDMENVNVGDYVTFGSYEQDNDLSNGKEAIRWRVLSKENGKALVISEKCLDAIPYNEKLASITWADCTLRQWLKEEFFADAFSDAEKQQIISQTIQNPDNPIHGTEGGVATTDRVFLLSIQEAEQYFDSDEDSKAVATTYAVEQGVEVHSENGGSWWCLRSPGCSSLDVAGVFSGGGVNRSGLSVHNSSCGLRPALYISY